MKRKHRNLTIHTIVEISNVSFFSATLKEKGKKDANGWDSLDEEISAAEEKKHGIKNLIKRRLNPRSSMIHRAKKDGSTGPTQINPLQKKTQSGHLDIPGSLTGKSEVKTQLGLMWL